MLNRILLLLSWMFFASIAMGQIPDYQKLPSQSQLSPAFSGVPTQSGMQQMYLSEQQKQALQQYQFPSGFEIIDPAHPPTLQIHKNAFSKKDHRWNDRNISASRFGRTGNTAFSKPTLKQPQISSPMPVKRATVMEKTPSQALASQSGSVLSVKNYNGPEATAWKHPTPSPTKASTNEKFSVGEELESASLSTPNGSSKELSLDEVHKILNEN